MKWGNFSAGLPPDGTLAAEWTGLELKAEGKGRFGLVPGYRFTGDSFRNPMGEIGAGYVESYIETWWKHPKLAALFTLKAADRYSYAASEGGGVLETSLWLRLRGGTETTARAFFSGRNRPVLIATIVDDNSLMRIQTTARLDDTGGGSEFSFITDGSVNLGRRWRLGGSMYLERSSTGFYSADLEVRGGRRYIFRASVGSYMPGTAWARLNYDPQPALTRIDYAISFYARIWLGGI
jgi:hypothetical protein